MRLTVHTHVLVDPLLMTGEAAAVKCLCSAAAVNPATEDVSAYRITTAEFMDP